MRKEKKEKKSRVLHFPISSLLEELDAMRSLEVEVSGKMFSKRCLCGCNIEKKRKMGPNDSHLQKDVFKTSFPVNSKPYETKACQSRTLNLIDR